jgi:hypothetical protein
MTTGYRANGNTAPTWRSCSHTLKDGRCISCRAVEVEYVQASRPLGAVTLGSPYLITPKIGDVSSAGRVAEFPGMFMPNTRKEAA